MSAATWDSTAQAHLAARLPIAPRWLVWTTVTRISDGASVPLGFWTGDDHETITVEGQSRLYYGAQGAMEIGPIVVEPGTAIGSQEITLGLSPEGETLVRGHRLGGAPIDLHCALYDPRSWALLGIRRYFRGFIDASPIATPEAGGVARLPLRCISTARLGTMTLAGKKSDASQRLRLSSDRFREYGDLGETASDPWGAD